MGNNHLRVYSELPEAELVGISDTDLVKELKTTYEKPLKLELQSFLDSVKNNTTPPISGEDELTAIKVATKCLKAI
jgi:predicted dehydrogenase